MSLSNGASSATLVKQKDQLPNPFELTNSQILDKVYLTHLHDDGKCDKDILFNLVSNVIMGSTPVSGAAVLQSESQTRSAESRVTVAETSTFKPEYQTLKLISCQMITTPSGLQYVHQTTMWILQHLRSFSWDAKALITLAAFSLEYGNFSHLYQIPATSDQLGNSLKQLNRVQTRGVPTDIIDLARIVWQVLQHIKVWAMWSATGYDTEDVPSLADALQVIPLVIYWAIAAIVASTGNLVGVSDYNLSEFKDRLSPIVYNLEEHLEKLKKQIDGIEDYLRRKKGFSNPKDIVDLLKFLIQSNRYQNPQVYDSRTGNKTDIEVFKQKHVLLFISSLDSIADEILLLNSIYDRLQENPKVVTDFKTEDFKILWIPIVDSWDEGRKEQFKTLKNGIKWYAVEYFSLAPGIKLIRENLNYETKPIIPVFNSQGQVINEDAMDLIFEWGIDAFPFRKIDGELLIQKWKWFWDVIKKVNPGIQIKGDRYIFIYGGIDKKRIQDFTLGMDKIKRHDIIKREDIIIEHHQLGKGDPDIVPRFWIGIESKKLKKHQERLDCEIQGIVKSLLCLKRDPQGWVILSKGSNIKILGHGEPMYQTVADFEKWKGKVLEKEGFDIAFKEYYDIKLRDLPTTPQPCAVVNVDNTSNVLATITCPNPTCGRVMEVASVNYKCCHRDVPDSGKI